MVIKEDNFEDLIKVYRITINIYLENLQLEDIPALKSSDGEYDERALDLYNEFVINTLSVFDAHDFEIIEEHQSPYSKSEYFSLVKKEDLNNADYKYILFIRLSDHSNNQITRKATKKFYSDKADQLKQPKNKSKQVWKLKEITVNNKSYSSYEDALEDIDKRLSIYD